jgi:hypothetical protein
MQPTNPVQARPQPWLVQLNSALDNLASALLRGDVSATEQASAAVQATLQRAPQAHELVKAGQAPSDEIRQVSQRLTQLRQAVLRNAAQSQRAVRSLLPQAVPATYGRQTGPSVSSTGGASRAYLAA